MRSKLYLVLAVFWLLSFCLISSAQVVQAAVPNLDELKIVAQLPEELPQRVTGLAYDGEQLWATVYLGRGSYAKLNPSTLQWSIDNNFDHTSVIAKVAGAFGSPGAVCFANRTLWIAGAYGDSFGSINLGTWEVDKLFKGKRLPHTTASQSYASLAFDGNHLWIVWHWFKYDRPASLSQLLLKVDPQSGKTVAEFPAPAGTQADMTHGLTWDGTRLWHMKDNKLSAIDPETGAITSRFVLNGLKRPSGLAWAKDALWISEFDGKIWHLPFTQ